ncbi:MAG: UDP-N-acetylmuramoyl-L-alanine--D-glutamate ligase [Chloroflexi bacterium]|nr:UDP-N-acetylmuramoyl-L-alanine--D-glutamate ligase [Chloroflexota bacterium]
MSHLRSSKSVSRLSARSRVRIAGFRGRRVGIVGLGREGTDLTRSLCQWGARVTVSDSALPNALADAIAALDGLPVDYQLGSQGGRDLLSCDEIFVSPGVPRSAPVITEACTAGIPISSGTRLFFDLCPAPIVGITGSSGKTTTTSLVGAMLAASGRPAIVGGNIGTPLLNRLGEIRPDTWCVLELSSFQLADMEQSPRVAAVLNIMPDHLDRHPDMEDYVQAKGNIVRHQRSEDTAVLNGDDAIVSSLPHDSRTLSFSLCQPVAGGWLDGDRLMLALPDRRPSHPIHLVSRADVPLRGLHNVGNVLAAATIAAAVGCEADAIAEAIRGFQSVPHRLETVGLVAGVTYVNDSIATTPQRSIAGLRAFETPVVLIVGGRDKHLPMGEWAREIAERARAVVVVGEAAPLIHRALEAAGARLPTVTVQRFSEAVPAAAQLAEDGDTVLLSPGCTSFDEFRDYAARGEAFRSGVAARDREGLP